MNITLILQILCYIFARYEWIIRQCVADKKRRNNLNLYNMIFHNEVDMITHSKDSGYQAVRLANYSERADIIIVLVVVTLSSHRTSCT